VPTGVLRIAGDVNLVATVSHPQFTTDYDLSTAPP
jgi:hypothetical protein